MLLIVMLLCVCVILASLNNIVNHNAVLVKHLIYLSIHTVVPVIWIFRNEKLWDTAKSLLTVG